MVRGEFPYPGYLKSGFGLPEFKVHLKSGFTHGRPPVGRGEFPYPGYLKSGFHPSKFKVHLKSGFTHGRPPVGLGEFPVSRLPEEWVSPFQIQSPPEESLG